MHKIIFIIILLIFLVSGCSGNDIPTVKDIKSISLSEEKLISSDCIDFFAEKSHIFYLEKADRKIYLYNLDSDEKRVLRDFTNKDLSLIRIWSLSVLNNLVAWVENDYIDGKDTNRYVIMDWKTNKLIYEFTVEKEQLPNLDRMWPSVVILNEKSLLYQTSKAIHRVDLITFEEEIVFNSEITIGNLKKTESKDYLVIKYGMGGRDNKDSDYLNMETFEVVQLDIPPSDNEFIVYNTDSRSGPIKYIARNIMTGEETEIGWDEIGKYEGRKYHQTRDYKILFLSDDPLVRVDKPYGNIHNDKFILRWSEGSLYASKIVEHY